MGVREWGRVLAVACLHCLCLLPVPRGGRAAFRLVALGGLLQLLQCLLLRLVERRHLGVAHLPHHHRALVAVLGQLLQQLGLAGDGGLQALLRVLELGTQVLAMPLDFGQPRRQVLFDGRVVPGAEAERDVAQVLELVNLHGASPGKIGMCN
eukprot:861140-Prorocentrum_minimum.AAC.1